MERMQNHKVGLALGGVIASWHMLWSLFVVTGFAQGLLDFIYSIHFLTNPFTVMDFNFVHAITLVVVTGVVGYIFGYYFSMLWNWLHNRN